MNGTRGGLLTGVNYLLTGSNFRWEKRPGALRMISIGKKEHIWGINAQQEIWKWNYASKQWDKVHRLCLWLIE